MPKTTVATNLVGRRVKLDYPVRWASAKPEFREGLKEEVRRSEPLFDKDGEIVAVYQDAEKSLVFAVLVEGRIRTIYPSMVTVLPTLQPATTT